MVQVKNSWTIFQIICNDEKYLFTKKISRRTRGRCDGDGSVGAHLGLHHDSLGLLWAQGKGLHQQRLFLTSQNRRRIFFLKQEKIQHDCSSTVVGPRRRRPLVRGQDGRLYFDPSSWVPHIASVWWTWRPGDLGTWTMWSWGIITNRAARRLQRTSTRQLRHHTRGDQPRLGSQQLSLNTLYFTLITGG